MNALRWTIGAVVRTTILLVVALLGVFQVRACSALPSTDTDRLSEVRAQLAFLRRAIRVDDALPRMQAEFPEGACFLATLYGLTWANVARESSDDALRRTAADEVAFALEQTATPLATEPFSDTQVRLGVFWSGQRNMLLAELLDLLPPASRPAALVEEFHDRSREIAEAFLASPIRHLDTFPGYCWPADQMAALASLPVHDRLYGTSHSRAVDGWKSWTAAHPDTTTGLPAGQIHASTGATVQPARGCGMSWMLSLLPRIDATLSREMYALYAEQLGRTRLGFGMFGEWPRDIDGPSDVDSGPIVLGVGVAATGIGLAAARANGDAEGASDIYALAQTLGLPWTSGGGAEKSYLLGELPMGDAFLAYGLSAAAPPGSAGDPRGVAGRVLDRWPFHAIVTIVQFALVAIVVRGIRRGRRAGATHTSR